MTKTKKRDNKNKQHSLTKKNKCAISLKLFEKDFSKTSSKYLLKQKTHFVKELLTKFAPSHIKPKDDFYNYINYEWLQNVKLEKEQQYIVQVDDFRLVQNNVYKQLNEIILDYIKNNNNKLSKNLKHYYTSVVNLNSKSYTKQLAKEAVELVDKFISEDNVWNLLGYINNDGMLTGSAPFMWSVIPDPKNVTTYRCYIESHHFAISDITVYYDDGTEVNYKKKYRKAFLTYLKKMFNTLLGNNDFNVKDIYDVEVDLFNALGCMDLKDSNYNKVHANEALSKYGFDWEAYSKALRFKKPPQFFIVSSLNYLKCASELLVKNWKTPKWRTFWVWILITRLTRITKDWDSITFDFYGKYQTGQEKQITSDFASASLYMSIPFNSFLTEQYIKKHSNPDAIEYVKILSSDLKEVFKRVLGRNKWLSPSTKKYALKKLDKFKYIYGKPENVEPDPDLDYTDVLYDNINKLMKYRHDRFVELEGHAPVDMPLMDWSSYPVKMVGSQAYIVNASYTAAQNTIYINLGYIQKPFVDLDERGIEYNLANIGYVIGHEMSHAFDQWGSKYGWDGNLYDWWTPEDKHKYQQIQKDVIKQYEEFAARDKIKFDASIGIGEDLADISGLAICDEYLRDFQEHNKDLVAIKNLSYQAFYTYYAMQSRQKVSKKAMAFQLKTNPHPPDKYRCNIPLSRSEIFRALYNIKKEDGMWWHNTNTVW